MFKHKLYVCVLKESESGTESMFWAHSLSVYHQLQVPSLSPSSSSWSWDREEDRRRQEKWQEEQERLLQVKSSFPSTEHKVNNCESLSSSKI